MTEPTYKELEIVARAMVGDGLWRAIDQRERNHWLHLTRKAVLALDEHRAAEWDKRITSAMEQFPKTRAYLAESERNEVAAEPPKHKDDF